MSQAASDRQGFHKHDLCCSFCDAGVVMSVDLLLIFCYTNHHIPSGYLPAIKSISPEFLSSVFTAMRLYITLRKASFYDSSRDEPAKG